MLSPVFVFVTNIPSPMILADLVSRIKNDPHRPYRNGIAQKYVRKWPICAIFLYITVIIQIKVGLHV